MTTPRFGVAWDKSDWPLPLALARRFYNDLGADHIRYLLPWPKVEPAREQYDWSFADETVGNAVKAGLAICLNPYFVPAWVTWEFDCLSSYDCACSKGSVSLPDSGDSARCYEPITIDTSAVEDLGTVLAVRYGTQVTWWGTWNEPGVRDYWLTTRDDTPQTAIRRWRDELAAPLFAGIMTGLPRGSPLMDCFVSQFDAFCDYSQALADDSTFNESQILDIFGTHPYADMQATPESKWIAPGTMIDIDATTTAVIALQRDAFEARTRDVIGDRPRWITEIQNCDNMRLMRETGLPVTDHNPARYVDIFDEWYHDHKGNLAVRLGSRSGTWELTDEGRRLAKAMRSSRRRSVRKWV